MSIRLRVEPADISRTVAIVGALALTFGVADTETSVLATGLFIGPEVLRVAMLNRASRAAREHPGGEWTDDPRPRLQATVSRFSVGVSFSAIVSAFVLLTVGHRIPAAIAALAVAGASGVAATTGVAMVSAMVRARRTGAFVIDRVRLETVWSLDAVVINSSETIALGEMRVCAVYPTSGASAREVLEAAAATESRCDHSIAHAIVRHAREKKISVPPSGRCVWTPGQGVRAFVDGQETLVGNSDYVTAGRMPEPAEDDRRSTTVFVVRGGRYLGAVAITDVPRPEVKRAIAELKSMAIETFLLASDSRPSTDRVARDLAVEHFEPGLTTEAKLARVQTLASSRRVAVIGEVIDKVAAVRPEITRVSLSADAPDDSADVVIADGELLTFARCLAIARQARAVILQNCAGAIGVMTAGVVLLTMGALTPLVAAFVHSLSDAAFILNAARPAAPDPR